MTRRIVTGTDDNGKATIVRDGEPPVCNRYKSIKGFVHELIWRTDPIPEVVAEAAGEPLRDYLPAPGEAIAVAITFPPFEVFADPDLDQELADQEGHLYQPGFHDVFEVDNPGMHTTHSVDFVTVTSGEIELELDDNECVQLSAGDIVIQNSTRHAWRNMSDKPASIFAVLVGTAKEYTTN